jgi:hypothetical protein
MSIWGCSSPATYCQLFASAGFIYADLRKELYTHLAPQALFFRVLLAACPFVFSSMQCYPLLQLQSFLLLFRVHKGKCPSLSGAAWSALPLLQAFPSPSTLGELLLLPSSADLFIYRPCEGVPFSHSLIEHAML